MTRMCAENQIFDEPLMSRTESNSALNIVLCSTQSE